MKTIYALIPILAITVLISGCSDTYIINKSNYYGGIWAINTSGMIVNITVSDIYYNITLNSPEVNSTEIKGVSINKTTTTITINQSGLYDVFGHISASGGNNQFYGLALGINYDPNVGKNNGCYDMRTTTTSAVGGFTFHCLARLNRGDILNLMVDDEAGTTANLLVRTYTLMVVEIDK